MKKILLIAALIIIASFSSEASGFYAGMPGNVDKEAVVLSLKETVALFNEHAQEMGGAGFLYGVKSKVISFFDDSHRDLLEKYILRTPEYMLRASGISEHDPALGKRFVEFCRLMPTVYDTRKACREKILECIKVTFPGESDQFYQDILARIYA